MTLIWGLPLVRGAVAATAELDGEPLDQAPVTDGRFTLIAVDAVHGFGDDLFLEVKLWDRARPRARLREPLRRARARRGGAGRRRARVSRWLAGAFAIAAVVGSAIAVWRGRDRGRRRRPLGPRRGRGGHHCRDRGEARAAEGGALHRLGERRPADAPAAARPRARQRRRRRVRLRALLQADRALRRRASTSASVTSRRRWARARRRPIRSSTRPTGLAASIRRSGWDACSTASNHSLDGGQAGIDGTVKALDRARHRAHGLVRLPRARASRPTILRVDGVKVGFVAYTDATNGFPAPHSWSLNEYSADDPKAGAKAIIRDARDARDAGADAVIAQIHWGTENSQTPERVPGRGRKEAHRREGDHGRRRPAPARRAADRARQRQVRRLQRGQPGLQPEPGRGPPGGDPGRARRPAALQGGRRPGHGPPGHLRPRPGSGSATTSSSRRSRRAAAELRQSYERTVGSWARARASAPACDQAATRGSRPAAARGPWRR